MYKKVRKSIYETGEHPTLVIDTSYMGTDMLVSDKFNLINCAFGKFSLCFHASYIAKKKVDHLVMYIFRNCKNMLETLDIIVSDENYERLSEVIEEFCGATLNVFTLEERRKEWFPSNEHITKIMLNTEKILSNKDTIAEFIFNPQIPLIVKF